MTTHHRATEFVYAPGDKDNQVNDPCWCEMVTVREVVQFVSHLSSTHSEEDGNVEKLDFPSSYYLLHTDCSLVVALDLSSYMFILLRNESNNIFLSLFNNLIHILSQLCQPTRIGSEERNPVIRLTFILFSFDWWDIGFFVKVLHQSLELRYDTITEFVGELNSSVMRWYRDMCQYSQNSIDSTTHKSIADILHVCIYSFNFLPNNQHKQILLVSLPLLDFPDMPAKNYLVTQLLDQRICCSFLTPPPSNQFVNFGYFPNYSALRFIARVSQGVVLHPGSKPSEFSLKTLSNCKLNFYQKLILTSYFQSKCEKDCLIESASLQDNFRSNKTTSSKSHKVQLNLPCSHLLTSLFQLGFSLDSVTGEHTATQLSRSWDESTLINIKISEFKSQPDPVPLEVYIFHTSHHLRTADIQDYAMDYRKKVSLPYRSHQVEICRQFYKELIHRLTILDYVYNSNLTMDVPPAPAEDTTMVEEYSRKPVECEPEKLKAILQNKVRQWHTWLTTIVFHLSLEEPKDIDNIHKALAKWGGVEVRGTDFYFIQLSETGQFGFVSLETSCHPLVTIHFGFYFSLTRNDINDKLHAFLHNIRTYFKVITPKLPRSRTSNSFSQYSHKDPYQFYTQDIAEIFRFNFRTNTFLSYDIIKCYFLTRSILFPEKPLSKENDKLLLQVAKLFVQNKVNDGWSVFRSSNYTSLFQQRTVKRGNSLHRIFVCYFLRLKQVEFTWQLKVDFFLEPIKGTIFSDNPSLSGISTEQLFNKVTDIDLKTLECALNFSCIGFDYKISSVPSLKCLLDNCSTLVMDVPLFMGQSLLEESHQFNDQIINNLINKLTDMSCLEAQIDVSLLAHPIYNTISETDHYLTNLIYFFKEQKHILHELLVNKLKYRFFYKMEVDSSEAYFITLPTCTLSITQQLQDIPNFFQSPDSQTFPILVYYVAVDRVCEVPLYYFHGPNSGMYNHPNMPIPLKHFLTYLQGEFNKSFVEVVLSCIARRVSTNPSVFQTCLDYCNQESFHSSLDLTSTLKTLSSLTALIPQTTLSVDGFLKANFPCFIHCPEKRGLYYFSSDQFVAMCERNVKLSGTNIQHNVRLFIQLKINVQRESGVCEDILLQDLTLREHFQEEESSIRSAILGIECYTFDTQPVEFLVIERASQRTTSSGTKQSSSGEFHLSLPLSHSRTSSLDRRDLTQQVLTGTEEIESHKLVKLVRSNLTSQEQYLTLTHDGLLTHLLEETQWQINDLTVGALSNDLVSTPLLNEIVDHIKQGRELDKLTCSIRYLHENITYSMLALTPGTKDKFMGELDKGIPGFRSDKYGIYYNLKLIEECYSTLNYWIVLEVSTECPKITFYIHYNNTGGIASSSWLFEQGNKAVESVCRRVFQISLLHDLYNNKMMYSQLSVDYHPEELEEGSLCFFQSNLACPRQFEYNFPVHWRLGRQMAQSLAKKYLEPLKCKNANSIYILEEDATTDKIYYMYINTVDNNTEGEGCSLQESRLDKREEVLLRFDVYGVTKPSKRYQELVFNNIEDKMYNEILTKLCDSFSQQANIQLFAQDIHFLQPDNRVDFPDETMKFSLPTFVELSLSSYLFYLFQYIYTTCTRLKKCFVHEVCFKLPSCYPESNLLELSENFFISAERPIQTRSIILLGVILVDKRNNNLLSFRESLELQSKSPTLVLDYVLSEVSDLDNFKGSYEINVMMWQHGNADCEKMRDKIWNHCNAAIYDFIIEYYFLRIPYSAKFESYSQSLIQNSPEGSPMVLKEQKVKPPLIGGIKTESRESVDLFAESILSYSSQITQDRSSAPLDTEFLKGVRYLTSHSDRFNTSTLKLLLGGLPDTFTTSRFFSLLLKQINPICSSFEFTQDFFQSDSQNKDCYFSIDSNSVFRNTSADFILVCRSPFHWLQSHKATKESKNKRIVSKKVAHISSQYTILKYPLDPNSENLSRDEPFFDTFKQLCPDDVITRQSFIIVSVVNRSVACYTYNCSKTITSQLSDNFNSTLALIRNEVCIWRFIIELKELGSLRNLVISDKNVREAFIAIFHQTIHSFCLEELLEKLNLNRISTEKCDFCHFSANLNQLITQYLNGLRRSYVLFILENSKIPVGFGMKDIEIILNHSLSIYYSTGNLNVVQFLRDKNLDSQFPQIPLRAMQIFPSRHKKNSSLIYTVLYSYVTQLILSGYFLILVNANTENQYELYLFKNLDSTSVIVKLRLENTVFNLQVFTPAELTLDQFIDSTLCLILPELSILSFENDFFLGYVHSILQKIILNAPSKMICLGGIIRSIISTFQHRDQPCCNLVSKVTISYEKNPGIIDYILKQSINNGLYQILGESCTQTLLLYHILSNGGILTYFPKLFESFHLLKNLEVEYEIYFIFDLTFQNTQHIPLETIVYVVLIRKTSFTGNIFNPSPIYAHSVSSQTSDKILNQIDFQDCCQELFDLIYSLALSQRKKEEIFQLFTSNIKATTRRVKLTLYEVTLLEQSITSYLITGIVSQDFKKVITTKRGKLADFLKRKDPSLPGLNISSSVKNNFSIHLFICSRDEVAGNFIICFFSTQNGSNEGIRLFHLLLHPTESINEKQISITLANHFKKELEIVLKAFKTSTSSFLFK